MAIMLDLSREFGFKISAFHHAIEAYKIADLLAANGVCGAEWADWWGSKMEMFDNSRTQYGWTSSISRTGKLLPSPEWAPLLRRPIFFTEN